MDFDPQWLLWLVVAFGGAFALGWLASRLDARQSRRERQESPKAYYKGLNLLLNEQHDKAIDAFIEAVQQDPDTSELHFALGDLFRRRGEYERAVRVHQHLLGRADLTAQERDQAQHGLAQDYMKAGLFDRAELAYRALAGTSFDTEARLALLDLHERSRDWRAAAEVAEQLEKSGSGSFASRIAHYQCELALEADASGQRETAEAALARARDAAPGDARPLVVSGEHAAARGDATAALRWWNLLMSVRPAAFNLVAARYATNARSAGEASAALVRLQALYDKAPTLDLLEAIAALQPDERGRRERMVAHLREHPTLAAAQALLALPAQEAAAVAADKGAPTLAAAETVAVRDAVRRAARPLHRYRCAACGFEAEHYFWQCPGCLGWDTYPPQRLEDQ
ncbi:MAG TPA: lipopolysaccharide assembly protein LapB [Caldimonas sp.]|jgi:lipopolysaccharide biosynthesis regulator YciM